MNTRFSQTVGKEGFTLVEILSAVAVLGILVVIIAQLMTETTQTITINENRISLEGEMRTVFASMSTDFTNMVKRTDMDNLFTKLGTGTPGANDYMFFYSEAPAYFDSTVTSANRSPFSLIGYCIASSTDGTYHLERYSRGLSWESPVGGTSDTWGPIFLTYPAAPNTNANPYPTVAPNPLTTLPKGPWSAELPSGATIPGNSNYHVIGEGIFRLEYCFLRSDGSIADSPVISTAAPTTWHALTDVAAVVVTVAVLDTNSQKLINGNMSALIGDFTDSGFTTAVTAGTAPNLMATNWQTEVNSLTANPPTGMPRQVLSRIRIYQHFFSLNND